MYYGLLKGSLDSIAIQWFTQGRQGKGIHVSQGVGSQASLIKYLHQTQES